MAKQVSSVFVYLGVKQLMTMACHPQTNGLMERYNKAIVGRLRHYVPEQQDDWDDFLQPLTYAYNMLIHRIITWTPCSLVLAIHTPHTTSITGPPTLATDQTGPQSAHLVRTFFCGRREKMTTHTDKSLQ